MNKHKLNSIYQQVADELGDDSLIVKEVVYDVFKVTKDFCTNPLHSDLQAIYLANFGTFEPMSVPIAAKIKHLEKTQEGPLNEWKEYYDKVQVYYNNKKRKNRKR